MLTLIPFCLIVICVFLSFILWFIIKNDNYNYWSRLNVESTSRTVTFPFGNILSFLRNKTNFAGLIQDLYTHSTGRLYGIYIGFRPALIIRDPQLIKRILVDDFHSFQARTPNSEVFERCPLLNNIYYYGGRRWKQHRDAIKNAFSPENIKPMFNTINDSSKKLNEYLSKQAATKNNVYVETVMKKHMHNVVGHLFFGQGLTPIECKKTQFMYKTIGAFSATHRKDLQFALDYMLPTPISFIINVYLKLASVPHKIVVYFQSMATTLRVERERNIKYIKYDMFQLLIKWRRNGVILPGDHNRPPKKSK